MGRPFSLHRTRQKSAVEGMRTINQLEAERVLLSLEFAMQKVRLIAVGTWDQGSLLTL